MNAQIINLESTFIPGFIFIFSLILFFTFLIGYYLFIKLKDRKHKNLYKLIIATICVFCLLSIGILSVQMYYLRTNVEYVSIHAYPVNIDLGHEYDNYSVKFMVDGYEYSNVLEHGFSNNNNFTFTMAFYYNLNSSRMPLNLIGDYNNCSFHVEKQGRTVDIRVSEPVNEYVDANHITISGVGDEAQMRLEGNDGNATVNFSLHGTNY